MRAALPRALDGIRDNKVSAAALWKVLNDASVSLAKTAEAVAALVR